MKRICYIFLAAIIFFLLSFTYRVSAEGSVTPNAKSSCLIEAKTKTVLYENEKDFRLAPASMTKIMTLTLVMDAIRENAITLDTIVTTSKYAASIKGSTAFLAEGETHLLSELIKCICIASANDASVTVAEAISGTEEEFVNKMNEKAAFLGLNNTNFMDSTGLSFKNHYSSSYDMAIMSANLINNYPEILDYTSIKQDYIRQDTSNPFWLVNTNKLLGIDGIDGLKTGWTNEAGYCISITKAKNGMRLISVVMGYTDASKRNKEANDLLNYGFANYKSVILYKKGDVINSLSSILYSPEKVNYVFKEDIYYITKKNDNLFDPSYQIESYPSFCENKGGKINIYNGDKFVMQTEFISEVPVCENNLFHVILNVLKAIFF